MATIKEQIGSNLHERYVMIEIREGVGSTMIPLGTCQNLYCYLFQVDLVAFHQKVDLPEKS